MTDQNKIHPGFQVSTLPLLTGKLDETGTQRVEQLQTAARVLDISAKALILVLAEREQQLDEMIGKLRERS